VGKPLLHPRDRRILAVATDHPGGLPAELDRRLPCSCFPTSTRSQRSSPITLPLIRQAIDFAKRARSLNSSSAALPKRGRR
jgi:hypothetical protein